MILNTRYLFASFLKIFVPDLVCDIGSMDGKDSLLFRTILPKSKILAFEANPVNYKSMETDQKLKDGQIDVFSCAISNYDGKANFNIYNTNTSGTSSLFERDDIAASNKVEVPVHRLDSFLMNDYEFNRAALWIDVEGAGYEVLEGIEKIVDKVCVVNVEVETETLRIGQKTKSDILDLLTSCGFIEVGINFDVNKKGFGDVLFFNQKGFRISPLKLFFLRTKFSIFYRFGKILVILKKLLPTSLWKWLKRIILNLSAK